MLQALGVQEAVNPDVPARSESTLPAALMPATAGWLLFQVKFCPATAAPNESVIVGVSCCAWFAAVNVNVDGVMLMLAIGHSTNGAGALVTALMLFTTAVILVFPGSLAVTVVAAVPVVGVVTLATLGSLTIQLKVPTLAVMSVAPLKACGV